MSLRILAMRDLRSSTFACVGVDLGLLLASICLVQFVQFLLLFRRQRCGGACRRPAPPPRPRLLICGSRQDL